jgi:hypothetical protein
MKGENKFSLLFCRMYVIFFNVNPCRFTMPPYLTLKNFEGLDLGKMDKVCYM